MFTQSSLRHFMTQNLQSNFYQKLSQINTYKFTIKIMKPRTPKLANILTLKQKILTLRNQLENIQTVQFDLSPPKTFKHAQKQNEPKTIKTPKSFIKNTHSDSPIKDLTNPRSNRNQNNTELPLNQIKNQQQKRQNRRFDLKLNLESLSPKNSYSNISKQTPKGRNANNNQSLVSNAPLLKTKQFSRIVAKEQNPQTPRFEQHSGIRTSYPKKHLNPLFLQAESYTSSKRMFNDKNRSPTNMYVDHIGSHTYMYMTPKNHQVYLSTTKSPSKKNQSQTIANTLMAFATTQKSPKYKQGKKHYSRHFNETVRDIIYRT